MIFGIMLMRSCSRRSSSEIRWRECSSNRAKTGILRQRRLCESITRWLCGNGYRIDGRYVTFLSSLSMEFKV